MFWKSVTTVTLGAALAVSGLAAPAPGFDDGRAAFAVRVNDAEVPYHDLGVFALPGESLRLEVPVDDDPGRFALAGEGTWDTASASRWVGHAPDAPGVYPLTVIDHATGDAVTLNLFVMVPASELSNGRMEGYRIGRYPAPLGGRDAYTPPPGFVRVTPDLVHVRVAPHFTLGQFLAKQAGDFPKFVALRTTLLLKLERLLEAVNATGRNARTLTVMSGFRTPFYNQTLGNTPNSRHIFGDAADVFIDTDGDGRMDDVNGDGRHDRRDAEWLLRLVETLEHESDVVVGGAGPYAATPAHGPFLHVDARGTRARW